MTRTVTEGASPVVVALEPDPRRAASVRVRLSSGEVCTIPADRAATLDLVPGVPLPEAARMSLAEAADEEAALRAGLASLGRRGFATADLGRRLRRRGHPAPAVEAALGRLHDFGLLDDDAFARTYVDTRAERGRGPARLRRDLMSLGVAGPVIDRALAHRWPSGDVDPDVPAALARRRARQLGDIPTPARKRRLLAYLARRGFTGEAARLAVRQALASERLPR